MEQCRNLPVDNVERGLCVYSSKRSVAASSLRSLGGISLARSCLPTANVLMPLLYRVVLPFDVALLLDYSRLLVWSGSQVPSPDYI